MNQELTVLQHLLDVGTISGLEAEDLYRVRDLPKRISVLRKDYGVGIVRELRNDHRGQRYARYSLDASPITRAHARRLIGTGRAAA